MRTLTCPCTLFLQHSLPRIFFHRPRKKEKKSFNLDNLNATVVMPPSAQRRKERIKRGMEVSLVGNNEIIGKKIYIYISKKR